VVSVAASLILPLRLPLLTPPEPPPVRAPVVQVGTSFSPARAQYLGLDWQQAYGRLLGMHFKVIRLSAYWSEADGQGYDRLDWLMERSRQAGQPVVLSVGMKGLGWPEFYIPSEYQPVSAPDGGDVTQDPAVKAGALVFIEQTIERYQSSPVLTAWQVENEPMNPAGPHRWWIDPKFVADEVAAVKRLDPSRPVIVNAFGSFNMLFDRLSNRHGIDLTRLLGFESNTAEHQSLQSIGKGDILGLDIYTRIGYTWLGQDKVADADGHWASQAGHWRNQALEQDKQAWITEAQAEPWETSAKTLADPRSTSSADIAKRFEKLQSQGYSTILLWGAEYWLWRDLNGDPSWVDAVQGLLARNASAPSLAPFAG
jgi:hypothetical protein